MADNSLAKTAMAVVVGVIAIAGGLWVYKHVVEPQSDGPMKRAGERIDGK